MYHAIKCKSQWIIKLLKCILCHLQYVGISETIFNSKLNYHRKTQKLFQPIFMIEMKNSNLSNMQTINRYGKCQQSVRKTSIKGSNKKSFFFKIVITTYTAQDHTVKNVLKMCLQFLTKHFRQYTRKNMIIHFPNNVVKTNSYGLKISKNIKIKHLFHFKA